MSVRVKSLLVASVACGVAALVSVTSAAADVAIDVVGEAEQFASGVASTDYSEVRLTLSPDGKTALWFSRDRPGGPGGYDIWASRRAASSWSQAVPVSFNSPTRDFDPAFSADGAYVYFCSDRAGGNGGDDVYRVAVVGAGFGAVENLGASVNSSGNEFAPMLSRDQRLLFSSDRSGGAGGHDLFVAPARDGGFDVATRLSGAINTDANEFDATFLSDGTTLVFARAKDFRTDRVDLFVASRGIEGYDAGTPLPLSINSADKDTYGPMLDWSTSNRLTFSAQRDGARSMDLYLVRYALRRPNTPVRAGQK